MTSNTLVSPRELVETVSLSKSTLYRLRQTEWQAGVHFHKLSHNKILYNLPLILDWVANRGSPVLHERAIRLYLADLPSSQPNKKVGQAPTYSL